MKTEWSADLNGAKRKRWHADLLDNNLIIESRQGNQRAFEEIYRRYRPHVWDLCNRLVGDPGWAEDLTQETFIRAYQRLIQFEQGRALWPWLATVARNICLDEMRVRQKRPLAGKEEESEATTEQTPDSTSEEAIARHERARLRVRVLSALATLQPADRRVVLLRAVEGWSYRDIARHDGRSIHAVRNAAWRARSLLRALLDDDRNRLGSLGIGSGFFARIRESLARFKDRSVQLRGQPSTIMGLTLGEHSVMTCMSFASLAASLLFSFSSPGIELSMQDRNPPDRLVGAHMEIGNSHAIDTATSTVKGSEKAGTSSSSPPATKSASVFLPSSRSGLIVNYKGKKPREKHLLSDEERITVGVSYPNPITGEPDHFGILSLRWKCGQDTNFLPPNDFIKGSC